MTDYTKQTASFSAKDGLPEGDPNKTITGVDFDAEFDLLQTTSATKADVIYVDAQNALQFNKAEAINTRVHQFELLPGFGKKHTVALLEERDKKPFENFEDLKNRVSNLPDPKKAIEKRIIEEIDGKQRYSLFVN